MCVGKEKTLLFSNKRVFFSLETYTYRFTINFRGDKVCIFLIKRKRSCLQEMWLCFKLFYFFPMFMQQKNPGKNRNWDLMKSILVYTARINISEANTWTLSRIFNLSEGFITCSHLTQNFNPTFSVSMTFCLSLYFSFLLLKLLNWQSCSLSLLSEPTFKKPKKNFLSYSCEMGRKTGKMRWYFFLTCLINFLF